MPIVVNTNSSAVSASFNLSRANDALRSSLERLSSGKRINGAGDDAGGMAVAYKLESQASRTNAMIQNTQNGLFSPGTGRSDGDDRKGSQSNGRASRDG